MSGISLEMKNKNTEYETILKRLYTFVNAVFQ